MMPPVGPSLLALAVALPVVVVAVAPTVPVSVALRVANVPMLIGLFKMAAWAVVFALASTAPETAVSLAGVVDAALAVRVVLVPTLILEVSIPTVRLVLVADMAGGDSGRTTEVGGVGACNAPSLPCETY